MMSLAAALVVGTAVLSDPLFDRLAQVKFINSGIVRSTDEYIWGSTWSGREPTSSAANVQASYVIYLELYNVSTLGTWHGGAKGGDVFKGLGYTYLWKKTNGSASKSFATPEAAVSSLACSAMEPSHYMDTKGTKLGNHENVSSWEACRALCCNEPRCGGYTYVNGSKAFNYQTCYLRTGAVTVVADSNCDESNPMFDCYSGLASDKPPPHPPSPTPPTPPIPAGGCTAILPAHMMDMSLPVWRSLPFVPSWQACRELCCDSPHCLGYTYINGANVSNNFTCNMHFSAKASSPAYPVTSKMCSDPAYDCYSGVGISKEPPLPPPSPPGPPPLNDIEDPPSGMRSAVPLGGISCGAVELRADGSFREWTIMNQSPGGSGKIQVFPDAYLAARVNGGPAVALQTHPLTPGVRGVSTLTYSGSYPVAKLTVSPTDLPGIASAAVYGFSTYKVNDMEASARPMAAFTFAVASPPTAGSNVSFMFNLPSAIEPDMARAGKIIGNPTPAPSSTECLAACNADPQCLSWNYVRESRTCKLQSDAPDVYYSLGTDCGLRGAWQYNPASQCLTLSRPGEAPSNGDLSVCASVSGETASAKGVSFGTYPDGGGAYRDLASSGGLNSNTSSAHGAVAVSAQLPPNTNATLTLTFGWYFPHRDHYGKIVGNHYQNLFRNSSEAAFGGAAPALRATDLTAVVSDILALQRPFHTSSLEPWLQDHLVNSLSHIRSALWFDQCETCHKSADPRTVGYWRQWEAMDCPDLDSIHNDGERHIPYIMFFPNSTRNKLAAWAKNQDSDGMLAEQISGNAPDTFNPKGRKMSDVSSMFIIYVLELLKWSGDRVSLEMYWPTIKRAADWQVSVAAELGLPKNLQNTYDILHLMDFDVSTYSAVFHILAMRGAAQLATAMNLPEVAANYTASGDRAVRALDSLLWVDAPKFSTINHTYCPDDFVYVGSGMTAAECAAQCNGSCTDAFLAPSPGAECYLCPAQPTLANLSGYTLLSSTGAYVGSWAAAASDCVEGQGCQNVTALQSDALYGQVLAYSVGLGTLVSSPDKLLSFLNTSLDAACVHCDSGSYVIGEPGHLSPGCDKAGMLAMVGRPLPHVADWMIWEGAAPNHASLAIRNRVPLPSALNNFKNSATSWSQRVNDQWNTAGLKDTDGYPTITSHYGYHMVSWHIPLAISGQLADLSTAANRSLTFAPAIAPPYTLPIMLPGVLGTVESAVEGSYRVVLTVGALDLEVLAVDGHRAPAIAGAIHLQVGVPVVWQV